MERNDRRRIHDHPKNSQDAQALRSQSEVEPFYQYRVVVPEAGNFIVALVEKWANEWIVDARTESTDADLEKRLASEAMVEEVAWISVI